MSNNSIEPLDQDTTTRESIAEKKQGHSQEPQVPSKPLRKRRLNNRLINCGFGLALLLLFGATLGFYVGIEQVKEKQNLVEHTYKVLEQIDDTLYEISQAEWGHRGYMISQDQNYISTYTKGFDHAHAAVQKLEKMTKENPEQQKQIKVLINSLYQHFSLLENSLKLLQQNPSNPQIKISITHQVKQFQEPIEVKLKQIEEIERGLLKKRQQEASKSLHSISLLVGIGYFLSFLLLLTIYRQIKQEIKARYQAEEDLQQTNEQLEARIQQRTAQLTQLNINLENEIEDRKQLEQLLRESEERFRQAIYEAPLPILIHAEDGEILQINWAWSEISGYQPQEIPTLSAWVQKVYGDNYERFRNYIRQLFQLNQRVNEGEHTLINRQGKTLIWDYYSAPLKTLSDGRRVRITMALDVTQRKEAEMALQASEARYATLTELAPVGIFHTDSEGNCIYINQHWCAITGLSTAEAMGTGWLKALHSEDQQRVTATWIRAVAKNTAFYLEYRFQNPNGKITWVVGQAIPQITPSGEVLGYIGTITDISTLKEAELALSQSEERFRQAVLNAPVPIAIHAEDGTVLQISRAWSDITGYTLEDIPTVADWIEKAYRTNQQKIQANVERLYGLTEPIAEGEYIITTKNGVTRIWEFYSTGLGRLSDGRRTVISTALDVTERKKVELQLKQAKQNLEIRVAARTTELQQANEQLLQELSEKLQTQKILAEQAQLLDLAHDTILTRDLEGTILFWNQGAEKMYGFSSLEAVGQHSNVLLNTVFPEPYSQILSQLFAQDYWEGELRHQKLDGTEIIVASRWVLQRDKAGNPSKILEINNDITLRKRAEEALQDNEAKFRSLSESSPIGIFLTDTHGRVLYTNPRYQEIVGGTAEEVLGEGWKQFIHPEDLENIVSEWLTHLEKQKNSFYPQVRYCHKNTEIRYTQVHTAAIFTERGQLTGFVGTVEDITERRLIEQMKKDFISVVSHELRIPLTAIHGSLGLLAAGVYDNKPEKGKKMLQIAATQTERLVKLVNDILDLGRLESGKLHLVIQPCEVAQLLEQAAELMRPKAAENQITLSVTPIDVQVWADFDSIMQTLTNLLSNAIKFSLPKSTISVNAELISSHDKIAIWQQKRPSLASLSVPYVLFQVKDQGRGIPRNQLELIFEKFQQVDATDSRDKGGAGLGLAICRLIIEQQGGQIWAESVLGEGSSFYFTLQLYETQKNFSY
ncbi:PAS domain S-box protein [Gloeothece verrucosa]|uniref:histidine kinase n=1 Tax=Gloeothece verrucosa (strain PCC 7822) TaxID=497965 RepID=E0U8S7_GLOV7|nr:PAS domain S-box protein [Gloeothece verrucosa]ADN14941.1 multi-sensor signal transduction histidine kinase [Gloeothece verrucosa PCC 7822]